MKEGSLPNSHSNVALDGIDHRYFPRFTNHQQTGVANTSQDQALDAQGGNRVQGTQGKQFIVVDEDVAVTEGKILKESPDG